MSMFNKVWSIPSEQKKLALQKKLNELLAGKTIKPDGIALDPKPDTLAAFLHIVCTDGTTLTVAEESVTDLMGGPDDAFAIRVNGEVIATL
ncbi:MAG: hypothetical protein G01um101419_684 [Parcubacteria group bacterium Gr01-1014_19]|nr:MAG: hypothetical protein G01um101419_684 [Parcubacteria group bacterium Gr01-1014_19]